MSNWINWRIAIVRNRDLSSGAKGMGLYLNTFMNDRHDFAFPSIATICGEMNMSTKTAVKYLKELETCQMLIKHKRFGKSTRYHATIPTLDPDEILGKSDSIGESTVLEEVQCSIVESTTTVLENVQTNNQENNQQNKQEGARSRDPDQPENLNPKAWAEWDAHRKSSAKMRKGWSPIAKRKAMNRLAKHSHEDQQSLVDYSIEGGYTNVYPDRLSKTSPRNGTAQPVMAAAHKPFAEPEPLSPEDKTKVQEHLDKVRATMERNQKRNQVGACRTPANLAKVCRHYGWGDPPPGLSLNEAKAWATKRASE